MKQFTFSIPEPCGEAWQDMTPTEKGRYCLSCKKEVVDFSVMTDAEVIAYIKKNEGGCGRFAKTQLGREMVVYEERKRFVPAAMLAGVLAVVMPGRGKAKGVEVQQEVAQVRHAVAQVRHADAEIQQAGMSQQIQTHPGAVTDTTKLPAADQIHEITGIVVDSVGHPIPRAELRFKDWPAQAIIAGEDGKFIYQMTGELPDSITVTADSPGYQTSILSIRKETAKLPLAVVLTIYSSNHLSGYFSFSQVKGKKEPGFWEMMRAVIKKGN